MELTHNEAMHPTAGKEAEPPPPPPGVIGNVTLETEDVEAISGVDVEACWPAGSTSGRQVVFVQLTNPDEFAAFGIFPVTNSLVHCCKVPFVAWGKKSADYDSFRLKMEEAGAEVGWLGTSVLPASMQARVADIEALSAQQQLLAAVDWNGESSNKDIFTRTAA